MLKYESALLASVTKIRIVPFLYCVLYRSDIKLSKKSYCEQGPI